jgi:hypothetical protein
MSHCRACGEEHSPLLRCEVAARRRAREAGQASETVTPASQTPLKPAPEAPKVTQESRSDGDFVLTGQVLAIAVLAAAEAGLPVATWLERAVRAYAAAPMTHAERQRAYRNRQASKACGAS